MSRFTDVMGIHSETKEWATRIDAGLVRIIESLSENGTRWFEVHIGDEFVEAYRQLPSACNMVERIVKASSRAEYVTNYYKWVNEQ